MRTFLFILFFIFISTLTYGQCTIANSPNAVATSIEGDTVRICKGESVVFDGSASTAQAGFNISKYYWTFTDGSIDSVSGPILNRTFPTSGIFRVVLTVRDDNGAGCLSANVVEFDILVAKDPIFNPLTVETPICLGESAVINAFPDQYAQDHSEIFSNLGGNLWIPDVVGQCLPNIITFGVFTPGAQLTNINDLLAINLNIEHSFMGDLEISITCPSGQSVMLHDQGGSGADLGVPIPDPGTGVGVGWDYAWSPTATNGDWAANAGGGSLPSGTYESTNPMSGLIGCDLNGAWSIVLCDQLGADDGNIFSWSIDFNPALYQGLVTFKPEIGLQADSSYWAPDPNAVMTADGNNITVTPTAAGNHIYNYTVIDNHGCINDTNVSVTVTNNPVTSIAGNGSAVACSNAEIQLNGSVAPNPGAVIYEWSPIAGLSNPNISNPIASIGVNTTYTLRAYRTGHPLCYTEDQIDLTVTAPPPVGTDAQVQYCQTDPAVDMFTLLGVGATPGGIWIDSSGANVNSLFNPAMQGSNVFEYEVLDVNGCRDTAVVTVDVALPFVLNRLNDTTICENGTAILGVNPTGGFGAPYVESWNQGLIGNGVHNVNPLNNQCYEVFVTDVNGCISETETICVNLNPPLQLTNTENSTICLNNNIVLDAVTTLGGDGGPYNYEWNDGVNTIASISQVNVSPLSLTQYCLTMTDNCESTPVTECLEVDLYEQPNAVFSADKVDGCFPIQVTFTNETDINMVGSVLWTLGNGTTSDVINNVTTVYGAPICYDVKLTVTSPDGCIDDTLIENYICPFDYPKAEFVISPNPTTFFDTNIDFENLSSEDAVLYNWDFGIEANPSTSIEEELLVRYPSEKTGVYPVTLIVENGDGCKDTVSHDLIVNSVFTLYVPNAFSPNNDGVNETFSVKGESVSTEDFLLRIFDRNGIVIFETNDIDDVWNGTSKNGTPLASGVYIWRITAKDIYSDDKKESFGHVSLLR